MKTVTKSNLNADCFTFENNNEVRVNRNFVVRGRVDNKRVYFVEYRGAFGQLVKSITCSSLKEVRRLV